MPDDTEDFGLAIPNFLSRLRLIGSQFGFQLLNCSHRFVEFPHESLPCLSSCGEALIMSHSMT